MCVCVQLDKLLLKFTWKSKLSKADKTLLKNKVWNCTRYHKARLYDTGYRTDQKTKGIKVSQKIIQPYMNTRYMIQLAML